MKFVSLILENLNEPQILVTTGDFLLVYKPPKMHGAPGKGTNTAEWCKTRFPQISDIHWPYGPGRKEVRPTNQSKSYRTKPYCTEILGEPTDLEKILYFRLRIHRGFRHQIRCHLTWAGFPILNDSLYGGQKFGKGTHLALRAEGIMFFYPGSGERLH